MQKEDHVRTWRAGGRPRAQERGLRRNQPLISDSQPPELRENKSLWFKLLSLGEVYSSHLVNRRSPVTLPGKPGHAQLPSHPRSSSLRTGAGGRDGQGLASWVVFLWGHHSPQLNF